MIGTATGCKPLLAHAFAEAGWHVMAESTLHDALARLADGPTLVLLTDQKGAAESARSLRARGGAWASMPILALADTASTKVANGIDGFLAIGGAPAEMITEANGWQPDDEIATIGRLEAAFGAEEVHALLDRFRAELVRTLAAPDWFGMTDTAHRLAGIAGTLGFAAVSRDWLAVSEGETVDRSMIYRHLRVAVATIDRVRGGPTAA